MLRSTSPYKDFDCSPSEALIQSINLISVASIELDGAIQRNIASGRGSEESIQRNTARLTSFIHVQDLLLYVQHQMPSHLLDMLSRIIYDVKHLEQESTGLIYLHKGSHTKQVFSRNQLFNSYELFLEPKLI